MRTSSSAAVLAVGVIFGCGSSAFPQTVADALPVEDPMYGDFGTAWIQRFGLHLDVPDVNADGAITNADLTQWLRFEMSNIHMVRPINQIEGVDPDDVPPCQQAALAMADYLRLVSGDVTLDGIVNETDVITMANVLAGIAQNPTIAATFGVVVRYDVNQDNAVDQQDLISITLRVGTNLGADPVLLAQSIVFGTPECGGGAPPPAPWEGNFRHPTHATVFSDTYPAHDRDFSLIIISRFFPNDHESGISLTWPIDVPPVPMDISPDPGDTAIPVHGAHRSNVFPPNHYFVASNTWSNDPQSHRKEVSQEWPPTHYATVSEGWYPSPSTLPPGMTPHLISISSQWDPNHRASHSNQIPIHTTDTSEISGRSPHLVGWSASWSHTTPPSSSVYPPNHIGSTSTGWAHSYSVSLYWPAAHHPSPSSNWPADKDPRWPPNHFKEVSLKTLEPGQNPPLIPPGIFPSDHSLWTTAQDLIP